MLDSMMQNEFSNTRSAQARSVLQELIELKEGLKGMRASERRITIELNQQAEKMNMLGGRQIQSIYTFPLPNHVACRYHSRVEIPTAASSLFRSVHVLLWDRRSAAGAMMEIPKRADGRLIESASCGGRYRYHRPAHVKRRSEASDL
jgi:hypothetical protein